MLTYLCIENYVLNILQVTAQCQFGADSLPLGGKAAGYPPFSSAKSAARRMLSSEITELHVMEPRRPMGLGS